MDELKVYSVRLESDTIAWADNVVEALYAWSRSDILRLALWVGAKVVKSSNVPSLIRLKCEEQFKGRTVSLEDVLRTAGVKLENIEK